MEVLLVYTKLKEASAVLASKLESLIVKAGHRVNVKDVDSLGDMKFDVDLGLAIGGDGTILRTFYHLEDPETPVLPVAVGRGGYLAEVGPEMAQVALERVVEGSFYTERHMRIRVEVNGDPVADVVNDAYVSAAEPGKVIEYSISLNGLVFNGIVSDGLVVSTPVGSTAYNFSCGGPAVDDTIECFVMAPVAPVTYFRPLVVSGLKSVRLDVQGPNATVLCDGFVRREVSSSVRFLKSPHYAVVVRIGSGALFERRLRKRLGWTVK
ncbi:MAG: NAD(+)/NADH kinase [Thaumarchaeota archaeon]|nr:NAD(+)/NADH kinase [Candidatus Calditenuaceae archaeon]MDW8041525.1 NAD(+)/NADH kinase [Nitrososphaerota archaeon]